MNKFWTKEEESLLRINYPLYGLKHCMKLLNRTEDSIKHKARKLGIKAKGRKKTHLEYENELFFREIDFYPIEQYIDAHTPINHTCLKDHIWKVSPDNILNNKGCPVCSGYKKKTTEQYQAQINFKVCEEYINAHSKIRHECSKGHIWEARPNDILSGCGCPYCATTGFKLDEPAILYYLKISKDYETYYKVGITNRTVKERFSLDKDKDIIILKETLYSKGSEARQAEKDILTQFKDKRVNIKDWLKSQGNTELFEEDILALDCSSFVSS